MNANPKRAACAIAGIAETGIGESLANMSPMDLIGQATGHALNDCGLNLKDIDGLFSVSTQNRMPTVALSEYLGIRPKYHGGANIGGASFMSMIAHAQAAIQQGMCNVALIAYGSTQRTGAGRFGGVVDPNPYEQPFKPIFTASSYALAASRHMHEYGTTREQLAEIAVAARQWAMLNPLAFMRKPLAIQDVLRSRMLSYPLTVRDSCLVTDGCGVIIMTSAERARSLKQAPIYILGFGDDIQHNNISNMADLTTTGATRSGAAAYKMAGLSPRDINVVGLYDAFTITTLLFLEDLGFCPKGEGGRFVENGALAPGGKLAVNTNGGGLSYCHPGMYGIFILIEAVRQLRGQAGSRQVKDCNTALAHGNGGVLSAQSTVILGTAATL